MSPLLEVEEHLLNLIDNSEGQNLPINQLREIYKKVYKQDLTVNAKALEFSKLRKLVDSFSSIEVKKYKKKGIDYR